MGMAKTNTAESEDKNESGDAPLPETLDFGATTVGGEPFRGKSFAGEPALLWFWALRAVLPMRRALLAAALISLLYAASDEYHQSFVEDRDGRPLDVLIDLAGIVIASLLLRYDQRVRSVLDGEDP